MEIQHLVNVFELESRLLDATLRDHPVLGRLFSRDFADVSPDALRRAYVQLLGLKIEYVQYTVPALRAAGEALRTGDADDRRWSELFLSYAAGESDARAGQERGHHVWARSDMCALGASPELLDRRPHPAALMYRTYFIDEVARHPYAILGAKGVLEHFSLRVSDDLVAGIVASGVANAEHATSFFAHHGKLDVAHVRDGDRNLARLRDASRRLQVVEGACMASGIYRLLADHLLAA
jgi:hypothetical protein